MKKSKQTGKTSPARPHPDSYVLGIAEGRQIFKRFNPSLEEMKAHLESCSRMTGPSEPEASRNLNRGERDFWKNQIKKASNTQGNLRV